MKDLTKHPYHDTSEKLVEILCQKTQSDAPGFFRVLVAYYFAKITSMMRVDIATNIRKTIPINVYAINLGPSGLGKGHSTGIIEDEVINQFREIFLESTFPLMAEENLAKLAVLRANKKNVDDEVELLAVQNEFKNAGELAFSFDSGTTAAVKQMRHKLLMAKAGSMNMEIDEIGSNLLGNTDVFTTLLELYDVGNIKQKLTKNTAENVRGAEIKGRTPTNLLLFGTPIKLFDGGKVEEAYHSFLEIGYARRCLFGYCKEVKKNTELTPEQVYDILTDTKSSTFLSDLSDRLGELADVVNFNKKLLMTKEVTITLLGYEKDCKLRAELLPIHEETKKAELTHRYFKALKLAGTYAFIDGDGEITEDTLYSAIKLVEESGEAFSGLLTRERHYVKLAKYIANVGREITHVDLVEDLPFYKGSIAQKAEMMQLAITYGYKNNIVIKRNIVDNIEFLSGESLNETDLNKVIISYGINLAKGYKGEKVKFSQLAKVTQAKNYHWCSHHFVDSYRLEDNAIPGFNLVVLDIDEGVDIKTAQLLMKKYTYMIYTTKRHTKDANRFRMVFPISHTLKLDKEDYANFMRNIYEWLPFGVDEQTNQRCKKWLSNKGSVLTNDGDLLNALLFIPKTTKSEQRKVIINDQQSLSNIERWFVNCTESGNRNNQLAKYAFMLVDSGMDINSIQNNVFALNNKLPIPMEEARILSSIMVTVASKIGKRSA